MGEDSVNWNCHGGEKGDAAMGGKRVSNKWRPLDSNLLPASGEMPIVANHGEGTKTACRRSTAINGLLEPNLMTYGRSMRALGEKTPKRFGRVVAPRGGGSKASLMTLALQTATVRWPFENVEPLHLITASGVRGLEKQPVGRTGSFFCWFEEFHAIRASPVQEDSTGPFKKTPDFPALAPMQFSGVASALSKTPR